MALADAVFLQNLTYSAEQTRRGTYGWELVRNAAGNIGSVRGGIVGYSAAVPTIDFATTYGGSGLTVSIATGEAIVPGTSTTTQSGYYVRASTTTSLTPAAADPSNPRIDLVYLQVNDAAYSGGSNNATCSIATGTPTSGATLTNLTGAPSVPTSSLAIAYVQIPAGASTISNTNILNLTRPDAGGGGYIMATLAPNIFHRVIKTGTYSAVNADHVIVPSGTFTITLPVPFPNARVKVTNYGTGTVTVSQNASEKIYGPGQGASGANTMTLAPYGTSRTYESDGTNWFETCASAGAVGFASGSNGGNTTLGSNTPTKIFDTSSLGVGTWLVTMSSSLQSDTTANASITLLAAQDTATATLTGHYQGQVKQSAAASNEWDITLSFVAVITSAGTLSLTGTNTGAGNAFALGGTAGMAGWTATQLA